jgi:hypothetical protein
MGLGDFATEYASGDARKTLFYTFEPWDVVERPQWVEDQIRADGVVDKVDSYGRAPHLFQSGIVYEYPRIGAIFAGTQTGKSYPVLMDIICQCTGEVPHALKVDKGVDTGVKRVVSELNIIRFGRIDNETGEVIDHNVEAEQDGTWDCGSIIGTGKYPKKKFLEAGDVVWIGTFKQARDENWWPNLKKNVPEHLLDKTKGTDGFSNSKFIVYFNSGVEIHIITYEQGYERFESVTVARCVLDEEPPSQKIFNAALTHCKQLTLVETPYRGITYTYHDIKQAVGTTAEGTIAFYHCTQYDCPYKNKEEIDQNRSVMPKWEIDARVYGLHSEQTGKPYFHDLYDKLHSWIRNFLTIGTTKTITLPQVSSNEEAARVNALAVIDPDGIWRIFEEPNPKYAYWMSADTARGDDGGDVRVDANVAAVFRSPDPDKKEDRDFPIEVASCRTAKETKFFARECLCAASYYNNAMIAPEACGFSAGTFINEIHGWPFMYTMTVTDDRTKRQVDRIGFNTNVKTRQQIFDEIGDLIRAKQDDDESPFRAYHTLHEIAKLITGKAGRPDHAPTGTSDSAIAFGIGLYIYANDKAQIRNNRNYKLKNKQKGVDTWGGRFVSSDNQRETRPILGSRRGMDARRSR